MFQREEQRANQIRNEMLDYGYVLPADFYPRDLRIQKPLVYDSYNDTYFRASIPALRRKIKRENRPQWIAPNYVEAPVNLIPSGLQWFITSTVREMAGAYNQDQLQEAYNVYQTIRAILSHNQTSTYNFQNTDDSTGEMLGIFLALRDGARNVLRRQQIEVHIRRTNNTDLFYYITPDVIKTFLTSLINPTESGVHDSTDAGIFENISYTSITFEFKQIPQGTNTSAGFFPFINTSSTDLSKYGIYSDINDERIAEPCVITALRATNEFSDNEMNEIESMVKCRFVPQQDLKRISENFKVYIYVRHYQENGTSTHIVLGTKKYERKIKLMIYFDHYIAYEKYNTKIKSNYELIKSMIKSGELRPMTEEELDIAFSKCFDYKPTVKEFNNCRPIIRKHKELKKEMYYGEYLFGYKPENSEIEFRLNQLQGFVNKLKLRNEIDVRCYNHFSELILLIMYEFGCFDNVYEFTGTARDSIRNSLVFPGREIANEINNGEINEKVYYVDFNGAFCSFMSYIPSGKELDGKNTKICELISILYKARLDAKHNGDTKFAITLKFLMTSCYGQSIKKPKIKSNKFTLDIEARLRHYGQRVIGYENNYVHVMNPIVEHYNFPQFAKVILDGFNDKVNWIKSNVNVLFQNCDAFVVSESDFHRLEELGLIDDEKLGALKVENVFTKMVFKNKTKWYGVNEDGSIFHHGA